MTTSSIWIEGWEIPQISLNEKMTRWKRFLMRGGLRAFGNGKKYSLKYISSIFFVP